MNSTVDITIIAALGQNREIGKNNQLIWRIKDDLKNFKKVTTGNAILMGHKTYDSIGFPLPNRLNIVLTRSNNLTIEGCDVVQSLDQALDCCASKGIDHLFICGGAQVYDLAFERANKLVLSHIADSDESADVFFPIWDENSWTLKSKQEYPGTDKNPPWSLCCYEKPH